MSRKNSRRVSLVFLFAFAAFLVYSGKVGGWLLNGIPAEYAGYFLAAFGVAGLLGVNIWYGGPFDKRLEDPPPAAVIEQSAAAETAFLTNVRQQGPDTLADLRVRAAWIEAGKTIVVKAPGGSQITVSLPRDAVEGSFLRFPGEAESSAGDLILQIRRVV